MIKWSKISISLMASDLLLINLHCTIYAFLYFNSGLSLSCFGSMVKLFNTLRSSWR